jgi:hypothetical protein
MSAAAASATLHTGIQGVLANLHLEPLPTVCAKISSAIYCFIFLLHSALISGGGVTCGTGEQPAASFVNQYCYGTSLYTCHNNTSVSTSSSFSSTGQCKEYMYHHPYFYWLGNVYLVASISMMTCSKLFERTHQAISVIVIILLQIAFVYGLDYILGYSYVSFMWPLFTDGMDHFVNINKYRFPIRSFCLYTYIGYSGTEVKREVWCSMPFNYVNAFYLSITWLWIVCALVLITIYSIRELVEGIRKRISIAYGLLLPTS